MYPSLSQIVTSLDRLSGVHPFFGFAFFGLKKAQLPIGALTEFRYSEIRENTLEKYYKFEGVPGKFFNPFDSPKKWVSEFYDSKSLQRIIADTFGDAFNRVPEKHLWGWKENYVQILQELLEQKSDRIPLFDIAVWLFRKESLQTTSKREAADRLIRRLMDEYHLLPEEIEALCDGVDAVRDVELSPSPATDSDILGFVGFPDDYTGNYPTSLSSLTIRNVGPFSDVEYRASKRLNLLAGDNSLGKTFLLELIWWSLTGTWNQLKADPLRTHSRSEIEIGFDMSMSPNLNVVVPYNRVANEWQRPEVGYRDTVLYFGFDGNVSLFSAVADREADSPAVLRFSREQVWQGRKYIDANGRERSLSNGLLHDIAMWQLIGERYKGRIDVFERALRALSPPEGPPLRLSRPIRIDGDSRELPTLRMPYGHVPFIYLSAGIQKAVSLAYILVWVFFDLLESKGYHKEGENNRLVILLDEIEAHLHPKWQRKLLPSLLTALKDILPGSNFQAHIATHSPLVMASLEPEYIQDEDSIHVLNFVDRDVTLESYPFVKQGTVNDWLESDIFGLRTARSKSAEDILVRADETVLNRAASPELILRIEAELKRNIPDDDPYWIVWNRFLASRKQGRAD